jgi:UDP-N-acetylmuramyl pentapeptide phosphotransferase/UDP-N-acetylglucosamine-1-phosphate transferase
MATLMLGAISFMDDLKHVNAKLRVSFHFVAAGMLMIDTGFIYQPWYALILAYLLIVGYINAGNFMDGINGMTAFFHIITFGSFILMENVAFFNPATVTLESSAFSLTLFPPGFVELLFLSVLVFAYFNARTKALVFAGDTGSISLSFLVAYLLVGLMLATGSYFWLLFIATYGIDTSYTMIVRLRKRQKPLEAHRTHLHHLLVDVKGCPHLMIAATYAIIQLIINVFTIRMIKSGNMNILIFITLLLALVGAYAFFRNKVIGAQRVVHANAG